MYTALISNPEIYKTMIHGHLSKISAQNFCIFVNFKPSIDIQITSLNNITTARLQKLVKPLPISNCAIQIDATKPSKPPTKLDHIQFSIIKATITTPLLSTTQSQNRINISNNCKLTQNYGSSNTCFCINPQLAFF